MVDHRFRIIPVAVVEGLKPFSVDGWLASGIMSGSLSQLGIGIGDSSKGLPWVAFDTYSESRSFGGLIECDESWDARMLE